MPRPVGTSQTPSAVAYAVQRSSGDHAIAEAAKPGGSDHVSVTGSPSRGQALVAAGLLADATAGKKEASLV